jgi:hypothetical protein
VALACEEETVSASEAIARLRELRAKATGGTWRANGGTYIYPLDRCDPKTDRIADCGGLDAFNNAAAIVAAMNSLESLLACAEAVQGVAELLGEYIDRKQTVDVKVALAFETARAALDALAKDAET